MQQLIKTGHVSRGSLGVEAQDLTPQVAQALGTTARQGALITEVTPDSPGAKAGLKPGDLVVAVDGKPINDAQDLRNAQGLKPLGTTLTLDVERGSKHLQVKATLAADANTLAGSSLDPRLAGASFVDLPGSVRQQGINGVGIGDVQDGSRAAQQGLEGGDIVIGVNNVATPNLATVRRALAMHPRQLILTIVRDGQIAQVSMQ
jgi:serine protease Do